MKLYIGSLDRFGYELRVLSSSEDKARKALLKEYRSAYRQWNNGDNPTKEEVNLVKEEMFIDETQLNEVHWV